MSKKTIAIDIDDVIANTTDALRIVVNKSAGAQLTPEHYDVEGDYWGYYESVWTRHKINSLVSFDSLNDNMITSQDDVTVIDGAVEAIARLYENYRLVAVTSRTVKWVGATKKWVAKNFPGMFDEIVFVHHDDNDGRTKGDACVELGASWLIDDNYEHCESATKSGVKALLFGDYGWNRKHHDAKDVVVVRNWQEVLEYFNDKD